MFDDKLAMHLFQSFLREMDFMPHNDLEGNISHCFIYNVPTKKYYTTTVPPKIAFPHKMHLPYGQLKFKFTVVTLLLL